MNWKKLTISDNLLNRELFIRFASGEGHAYHLGPVIAIDAKNNKITIADKSSERVVDIDPTEIDYQFTYVDEISSRPCK